jgi:bifunctional non-homologous end joining protein LigD
MADDDRPSPDALKTYKAKRRFDATPEPAEGGVANEKERAFVIQKHWATRLHYDFRLELEGTMKSWAVPKGPSYDPRDKRMAMPTEDHPIAYNRFEGTIPAGNYGAGKVIIWDKGTWIPLEDPHKGWRDGKLKFEMRGHKMHGHWTLVRMKGRAQNGKEDPWLLIKERDAFVRPEHRVQPGRRDARQRAAPGRPAGRGRIAPGAAAAEPAPAETPAASGPPDGARPAALPDTLQPELAVLVDGPPADPDDWVFEIKFDGYRMLARAEGGKVRLVTRNGHDWTSRLAALRQALQAWNCPTAGTTARSSCRAPTRRPTSRRCRARSTPIAPTASSTTCSTCRTAPATTCATCRWSTARRAATHRRAQAASQRALQRGVRGAAAGHPGVGLPARAGRRHRQAARLAYVNRRSSDWIKLKCAHRQEFVIGGWTEPKGSRAGIGSLLLGVHGDDGKLRYAGNVGTGFNDRTLRDLRHRLDGIARPAARSTAAARACRAARTGSSPNSCARCRTAR